VADTVILRIPADTGRVRIARLVAAAIADDIGFDLDEIDDLRLAVDELCFALLDAGESEAIEIVVGVDGDTVEVTGSCTYAGPPSAVELGTLAAQLLGAVVDTHEVGLQEGEGRFRLRKRRT